MTTKEREHCEWVVPGVKVRIPETGETFTVKTAGSARFIAEDSKGQMQVIDYGSDLEKVDGSST